MAAFAFDRQRGGSNAWELEDDDFAEQPWAWTLQWNRMTPMLVAGTCPCTTEDADRLMQEEGISAFVCIQNDKELEALDIDYPALYEHVLSKGGVMHRCATHQTNIYDYAQKLPMALRTVIANLNAGRHTYVYGTRSELRVAYILIMYFCYFEKLEMDVAMEEVARLRPVTKPHVELWLTVDDLMCTPTHRSVIAAHDYEERSFPTGVFSSMDMWLSDFLIHLEQQTLYPGEHPMARQLERM